MAMKNDPGQKPTATLQRFLLGVAFPATRDELLEGARRNQAPQEILSMLNELPEGEAFHGTADILRHAGGRYAVY